MKYAEVCLFSPFSSWNVKEEHNRVLLLQFLIQELLAIHETLKKQVPIAQMVSFGPRFFPYGWVHENDPLSKAYEHASLLPKAFPRLKLKARECQKKLNKLIADIDGKDQLTLAGREKLEGKLKEFYLSIEKLIHACRDNENLLLFLLKHQKKIDQLMGESYLYTFLLDLYPKGLGWLEEMLCDNFHERGFFSLIPELKELIGELGKYHV
jgi:hypothetical protein